MENSLQSTIVVEHFLANVITQGCAGDSLIAKASKTSKSLFTNTSNSKDDIEQAMAVLLAEFEKQYRHVLGRNHFKGAQLRLKNSAGNFIAEYNELKVDGWVKHISKINDRYKAFIQSPELQHPELVERFHAEFCKSDPKEQEENINSILHASIKIVRPYVDRFESEQQLIYKAEKLTEKIQKVKSVNDLKETVVSEGVENILEKNLNSYKTIAKLNSAILNGLSQLERQVRPYTITNAARLMGFLDGEDNFIARFSDYANFCLRQLEHYPFGGLESAKFRNDFRKLVIKSSISIEDYEVARQAYNHLQGKISSNENKYINKALAGLKESPLDHADPKSITEASVCIRERVELFKSVIDDVRTILLLHSPSTVNSRIVAQLAKAMIKDISPFDHQPELMQQLAVQELLISYKGIDGLAPLLVLREFKQLAAEDTDSLSFIKRLRPSGLLERFAYTGPDNGLSTVRVVNSLDTLGPKLMSLKKLTKFIGFDLQMLSPQELSRIKDAFKSVEKMYREGNISISKCLQFLDEEILTNGRFKMKRTINKLTQEALLFHSERNERLTYVLSKLNGMDIDCLSDVQTVQYLELVKEAAGHNVVNLNIKQIESIITGARKDIKSNIPINRDIIKQELEDPTFIESISNVPIIPMFIP